MQKLAYEQSTCADPKYLRPGREGHRRGGLPGPRRPRVAARAGVGKGLERTVAFNRRFKMRDGRTITHPGQGNPDIVEPAGPTDPEVGVIGVWDEKGKLLGCVVNFACHATTSPGGISANYIYYLEKVIQGYYGKDAVVVFLNGASGDMTQVDNRSPYQYPDGERLGAARRRQGRGRGAEGAADDGAGRAGPGRRRARSCCTIKRRVPAPERVKAVPGDWCRRSRRRSGRRSGPSPRRSSCWTPS